MTLPPIEPAADLRAGAQLIRQLYLAYLEVGFTDDQAMLLVRDSMNIFRRPADDPE